MAHLPEWRLVFAHEDAEWGGGLPSAEPGPGNTVWGVVFEVSKAELAAIGEIEAREGREAATVEIMDRNGRRHEVVTHLYPGVASQRRAAPLGRLHQADAGRRPPLAASGRLARRARRAPRAGLTSSFPPR